MSLINPKPSPFKIVSIPNQDSVVVNAGENDVSRGQVLEVYIPGSEIIDPDTHESLGVLDKVKAQIEVVAVYPKMCLCKNNRKHSVMSVMQGVATGTMREPLPVDLGEITGELIFNEEEQKLKIGDLVRKVLN